MSKLTADDVRQIRAAVDAGTFQSVIAEKFGISQQTVSEIKRGVLWGWLN